MFHRTRLAVSILVLSLVSAPLLAQDSALQLAPANTNVYLQVDNLAQLRADWENDPLSAFLRENKPRRDSQNEAWAAIQAALGMPGAQIIDRFLGQEVAIIGGAMGPHQPAVIVSRINEGDADFLVARLELLQSGKSGAFNLYNTKDGKGRIAMSPRWIVACEIGFGDWMDTVLKNAGKGGTLADDAQFKEWVGKLTAQRNAVGFARNPATGEVHALAMKRVGRNLEIYYAGKPDKAGEVLSKLGSAKAGDFGPLPRTTLAAATFNILDKDPQQKAVLDRLLAPKTFDHDVLPHLDAPGIVFLGQVPGESIQPNPGLAVPAIGMAIKLKNPQVAAELDRIVDGGMLLANLATVRWKTDPIAIIDVQAKNGEGKYRVAQFGKPLAQRSGRPELAALDLAYGRVGDWYVVCTQRQFFEQCLAAARDEKQRFAPGALPKAGADRPVMSAVVRSGALADHLQTWIKHWQDVRPAVLESAATQPVTPEGKFVKRVVFVQGLLEHYDTTTLQVWAGEEKDELRARVEVTRK